MRENFAKLLKLSRWLEGDFESCVGNEGAEFGILDICTLVAVITWVVEIERNLMRRGGGKCSS
jgi:hypothetical protein